MKTALVVALLLVAPAAAQESHCELKSDPGVRTLTLGYRACVIAQAKRLSRSGEAAESVATAAAVACSQTHEQLRNRIEACDGYTSAEIYIKYLDPAAHDLAVSAVVEARAAPPRKR